MTLFNAGILLFSFHFISFVASLAKNIIDCNITVEGHLHGNTRNCIAFIVALKVE